MKGRTDKTGQFVLEVEKPADNADAVFEEAQAAEERTDIETAERLYRRVIKLDPAGPAAPFNLGNVLRSSGRTFEAEAAYREAVRADPSFASAWYNLADVLDDQRRIDEGYSSPGTVEVCRSLRRHQNVMPIPIRATTPKTKNRADSASHAIAGTKSAMAMPSAQMCQDT